MASTKFRFTWKNALLPIIGLVAFFAYIYIFNVDLWEIGAAIQQINIYFYLWAAVAVLIESLFFALAWFFLLRFLSVKLSIAKALAYVWFGVFMDILIPAESISGEISKVYLVTREQNGMTGKVTASLIAQRLIGMGVTVATLFIGAMLLLVEKHLVGIMLNLVLILVALSFLFLSLLLLLCVKENWTLRVVDAILRFIERISRGRWKLSSIRDDAVEAAKSFHAAMREYGRAPKTIFVASFCSTVSWIFSMSVFYLTFMSIGYTTISWTAILVISAIFAAVKSIPMGIPFEVGLPEITLTTLFIVVGVPPDISATATILIRILTLWFRFFIGFAAQQWLGLKAFSKETQ